MNQNDQPAGSAPVAYDFTSSVFHLFVRILLIALVLITVVAGVSWLTRSPPVEAAVLATSSECVKGFLKQQKEGFERDMAQPFVITVRAWEKAVAVCEGDPTAQAQAEALSK